MQLSKVVDEGINFPPRIQVKSLEFSPMMKPAVPALVDKLPENTKVIKDSIKIFLQFTFDPILLKALRDSSAALEAALKKSNLDADDKAQVKVLQNILNPEQAKQTIHRGSRIGAAFSSLMPSSKPAHQIMISYNWDSQSTMKKIHSELVAAKYKVWFDLERMAGQINDRTAETVEGSEVVLICVSSKYKDSANCRLEGTYAQQLKKQLVFLMMERGYKANGWLGLIMSDNLWIDCTDPENPDVAGLIENLSNPGVTSIELMSLWGYNEVRRHFRYMNKFGCNSFQTPPMYLLKRLLRIMLLEILIKPIPFLRN